MVLCDAFHTKYTKHLRRRNDYLVYQRIEIISTNAYFQNSHNTCRYLYSWGSNIMGCFLIVCVCSVVVAAFHFHTIRTAVTHVGVALGKIFISRLPHYNAIIPDRKWG